MHSQRWISVLGVAVLLPATIFAGSQQPPSPPETSAPPAAGQDSSSKQKPGKHQHDFLVRGTVFTPEGLGFAGAKIRIRRAGEKKFRWEDFANRRGEFAIRVQMGSDYEVVVTGKGFKEQTHAVDAKTGARIEEFVVHMEREGGKS